MSSPVSSGRGRPGLRLQALFSVEVEAADYREAAVHQASLEACLAEVRALYPEAVIRFPEAQPARPRASARPGGARPARVRTGALHVYE